MLRVLNSLASRVDPSAHPLLDERAEPKAGGRVLLIVVTADRGLVRQLQHQRHQGGRQLHHRDQPGRQVALGLVGRRGRDFFARRGFDVRYEQVNLFAQLNFEDAQAIARAAIEAFVGGEVDSVYLVVQRVQVGHGAARRRRAAAADPAGRAR